MFFLPTKDGAGKKPQSYLFWVGPLGPVPFFDPIVGEPWNVPPQRLHEHMATEDADDMSDLGPF